MMSQKRRKPRRLSPWIVLPGMLLFGFVLYYTGRWLARPFILAEKMCADNEQLERRILALEKENQQLRKSLITLTTPQGMEREARRYGYVRPGEAVLVIP